MGADPFFISSPTSSPVPVVVSSPHSGTEIPADIAGRMAPSFVEDLPDTDWFIHELYSFVTDLGATLVHARFSRFVIDLNRHPGNQPIYNDGRFQTSLVPMHSFSGDPLYLEAPPQEEEVVQRKKDYYLPYYEKLNELLTNLRSQFGRVLLFDAHSIRREVPSIQEEPFPDLIVGDREGSSASDALSNIALKCLKAQRFDVAHNLPFRGGNITSHFGKPSEGIHALQLEMSQDVYMDERPAEFSLERSLKIRAALKEMFQVLIEELQK